MKIELDILDNVRIAAPCNEDWNEMQGDDRVRHCEKCDQNVYNISAMSRADAIRLFEENEKTPCLRIFRRHDGTVLTNDCPIGLRIRQRARRWVAAIAGMLGVSITATSGCIMGASPTEYGQSQAKPAMGVARGVGIPLLGEPVIKNSEDRMIRIYERNESETGDPDDADGPVGGGESRP